MKKFHLNVQNDDELKAKNFSFFFFLSGHKINMKSPYIIKTTNKIKLQKVGILCFLSLSHQPNKSINQKDMSLSFPNNILPFFFHFLSKQTGKQKKKIFSSPQTVERQAKTAWRSA